MNENVFIVVDTIGFPGRFKGGEVHSWFSDWWLKPTPRPDFPGALPAAPPFLPFARGRLVSFASSLRSCRNRRGLIQCRRALSRCFQVPSRKRARGSAHRLPLIPLRRGCDATPLEVWEGREEGVMEAVHPVPHRESPGAPGSLSLGMSAT